MSKLRLKEVVRRKPLNIVEIGPGHMEKFFWKNTRDMEAKVKDLEGYMLTRRSNNAQHQADN